MVNLKPCPVCERSTPKIEKWRGVYLCGPCLNKFEKIERVIANGQTLTSLQLDTIVSQFGVKELDTIKESDNIKVSDKIRGRKRRRRNKDIQIEVKPSRRRKKSI